MKVDLKIDKKIFNKAYYPYLFDYSHRYEVFYGGAGSGKSVFVAQKLLIKALKEKRKILVIRKVMATQLNSCWQLFLDTLSNFHLLEFTKINKANFKIELPNGSIFLFAGVDDVEKLKSIAGITDIWIEEATELNEDEFLQLDLRLRAKVGAQQIVLSFNPISKANWCYKRWFARPQDENTFILKTTYKDNRFLPQSYIKSLEKMMDANPYYYRVYALGEFASLDKLIYSNWEVREFDYRNLSGTHLAGLDFGFSLDTTAFVASLLDEDTKTIYLYKEWTAKGKTNSEIASVLSSLGYAKTLIVCDSAEPKSIEELKRAGLIRARESIKGKDSIIYGIQKLQQYKLVVLPSCVETITELENYAWQKDRATGEYINKPIDDFNHCLDALRYSLQCVKDNRLKTVDKKLFGF